ncbi:MAG: GTP-binding protein [Gammaproteobacteria bacterium]|nr:GTP-binding protein [Gammaproteobacteria bacterium]
MPLSKLENIPTNLIMGFLGVGKTTAIINLLKQKPKLENWAVLVNEFGTIGIDGSMFAESGATVKEIPGGCLCCAVGLPFQVGVNQLIKQARPDRLLIEPSGLGHPKQVLDMLTQGPFHSLLELRASICLVDPNKLTDSRYTSHETFMDQIALSDVIVANKTDLADKAAIQLFHRIARQSEPYKNVIAECVAGQLELSWLDSHRNPARHTSIPESHKIPAELQTDSVLLTKKAEKFKNFSRQFPSQSCFDYLTLSKFIRTLKPERLKAIIFTNKGWLIINSVDGNIDSTPCKERNNSHIEIITTNDQMNDLSSSFDHCLQASIISEDTQQL